MTTNKLPTESQTHHQQKFTELNKVHHYHQQKQKNKQKLQHHHKFATINKKKKRECSSNRFTTTITCETMTCSHNLLQLVDILRTISDTNVPLHCLKLVIQECTTPEQYSQINKFCNLRLSNSTTTNCNNNINTTSIDSHKTRQTIQFGIKKYYKQCQNFSFIEKIHCAIKNRCCSGKDQSITISSIPETRASQKNTRLVFTEEAFSIESIMINIFEYLHLNELSNCRGVCQQWLYDASNTKSVYHVDTFYIRRLINYFMDWKHEIQRVKETDKLQIQLKPGENTCIYVDKPDQRTHYYDAHGQELESFVDIDIYIDKRNDYIKGIARYNLSLINNCRSLTIDASHWGKNYNELDCYSILNNVSSLLKKVQILQLLLPMDFQLDLLNLIDINKDRVLKSVKLLITHIDSWRYREKDKIQTLLRQLSWINYDTKQGINRFVLNAEKVEIYTKVKCYLIDHFMIWFDNIDLTTVKTLEFKPILWDYEIRRQAESRSRSTPTLCEMFYGDHDCNKYNRDYRNVDCFNARKFIDTCVAKYKWTSQSEIIHVKWVKRLRMELQEWYTNYYDNVLENNGTGNFGDELRCTSTSIKQLVQDIGKWNQLMGLSKGVMRMYGINLVLKISFTRARFWMDVGLDLSKSKQLMKLMQLLYQWCINGNVSANIWFHIQHEEEYISNRRGKSKNIGAVHDDLKKEKWIQLIVKAVKKVFCPQLILNYDHDIQAKNEIYSHYPFENGQSFPICVKLCDRITIKLFKPQCITEFYWISSGNKAVATTLCLMIKATSQLESS